MTQDVQQRLTEIQSLQQRLAHASQERAAAYEQLSRWQRSYQTEAQQRRKDIQRLQIVIYRLDQENKRLKQQLNLPSNTRSARFVSHGQVTESCTTSSHFPKSNEANQQSQDQSEPLASLPLPDQSVGREQTTPLQQQLKEAIAECDRFSKALAQERANHQQTRQTLMNALGDTVEQLERERNRHALLKQQLPQQQCHSGQTKTNSLPSKAHCHSSIEIVTK